MLNLNIELLIGYLTILWAVIDPIGTIPVFIASTRKYDVIKKQKIALFASFVAFIILIFFMIVGEFVLTHVGVPLAAFQISGGIILFLFAVNMIFGDSKPEEEIYLIKTENETAIFPLATPSIAGPGAILTVVLLANSSRGSLSGFLMLFCVLIFVLFINYILMIGSNFIHKRIGDSGAIVISKIMGLILASMAANNVLLGVKIFFNLG